MGANNQGQAKIIKWEQVSKNNTEKSCWIVIAQKVYDVTHFAKSHPGGSKILYQYSGGDATEAFSLITSHSKIPISEFQKFYVGDIEPLAQPRKYKIKQQSSHWENYRYTANEVSKHNKKDDLWVIIDDFVYDLTEFQKEHPGGTDVLEKIAGKDATQEFYQVSGHPKIENTFKYRIGKLKK